MPKRQRKSSSSSASSSSSSSGDSASERQRLLALLDAQCGASTGVTSSLAYTAQHGDDAEHSEEDENDMETEQDSEEDSDHADDDDDEWSGILATATENVADRSTRKAPLASTSSIPSSSSKKAKRAVSSAPVVYFDDASTSRRTLDVTTAKEKDSFMSTKIRRADATTDKDARDRKGKGRQRATSEELAEEKQLQQLDSSLLSLIKELPASTNSTSLLPKLDALTLPDPRHTVRKDKQAPIDKRAPRLLREALYSSRQKRAINKAQEDKEAGIVSANASRNRNELNGFALTKARRRQQTGEEGKRRQAAKGLGGVVGKMRKGGAVLTLSRDEIRRGNEGDLEGLQRRKRAKGGPPSGKGKGGRR